MRLSVRDKSRVVTIYLDNNLHLMKYRFAILQQLAAGEDIEASEKTMSKIIRRWQETGKILLL